MSLNTKHLTGCCLLCVLLASPLIFSSTYNISAAKVTLPRHSNVETVDSDFLVVFAGFIGCSDYCPTSLQKLSYVLDSLPDGSLTIAFLNIVKGIPHRISDAYAKSIDERFIGYTVSSDNGHVTELYQSLGISTGDTPSSVRNHPSRVYLFKKSNTNKWILTVSHSALPSVDSYTKEIYSLL